MSRSSQDDGPRDHNSVKDSIDYNAAVAFGGTEKKPSKSERSRSSTGSRRSSTSSRRSNKGHAEQLLKKLEPLAEHQKRHDDPEDAKENMKSLAAMPDRSQLAEEAVTMKGNGETEAQGEQQTDGKWA